MAQYGRLRLHRRRPNLLRFTTRYRRGRYLARRTPSHRVRHHQARAARR